MKVGSKRLRRDVRLLAFVGLLLATMGVAGCVQVEISRPAAVVADVPVAIPSPTSKPVSSPSPTPPTPTMTATPTVSPTPLPTATPTHTPSPTPTPALPVRLRIPAIGVDAWIEPVGLTEDQAMDVPSRWEDVAWFELGYRPGEAGNAVIAGHLDTNTGAPAVFWNLNKLQPGDEVIVVGEDGRERRFVVQGSEIYPYDQAPVQRIFGPAEEPRLNLITCDGAWDREQLNYTHRLVVYTVASGVAVQGGQ